MDAKVKQAIDAAWAKYRAESQAIPRTLPFSGYKRNGVKHEGFVEIDERLWRAYVEAEREAVRNASKAGKAA